MPIAQLLEEASILDCDHRLVGEGGGELDLFVCEGFDARAANDEYADQRALAKKRNAEYRAGAGDLLSLSVYLFRILQHIGDVDRTTL